MNQSRSPKALASVGLGWGAAGVISPPGAVAAQDSPREPDAMCRGHRSIVCRSFDAPLAWNQHDITPSTNCERLRKAFENREAIYVERGALRVKVTNIRANVVVQTISADIEEIPQLHSRVSLT